VVDTIAGYRLAALVGRGSAGTVWLARREGQVDQVVAVKRIPPADPDAVDALRREAEILASLDHPHVVALLDLIDDPPGLALVMPLARGGSLRHLLDECGTLAAGQVVAALAPIADALASAHRRGVVHGDVKPANLLFTSDGEPLLADFGVARHLGARAVAHLPLRGTAAYLDPALLDGTAPTGASDVYALGVVAYEALTGRPPHRGTDAEVLAAADAASHQPLRATPSVPADLATVVDAALARDPRNRPAAAELSGMLRASVDAGEVALPGPAVRHPVEVDGRGTRLFGPRPPVSQPSPPSSRRWAVVAVAVVVAMLAVAGAWWVHHDPAPPVAGRHADTPVDHHGSTPGRTLRCPPAVARGDSDGRADGQALPRADLDGDGCPDESSWDGLLLVTRLSTDPGRRRAFRVGQVGDRVVLGDWDCDGVASPALYRPDTGEVLFASRLATEVGDRVYAERVERRARGGIPRRVAVPGGCDEVRVGPTGRIAAVGR